MSLLLLLLTGSIECANSGAKPGGAEPLWLLAKSPSRDAVHASDTETSLRARYGAHAVRRGRVELGEGETEPGIVLFPDDPDRRLEIEFKDTLSFTVPIRATVRGCTRWTAYPGVTIGTHLDALERLNHGPFTLLGLDWDGGGTVMDWKNGDLARLWRPSKDGERLVLLRLGREPTEADYELAKSVSGDREFHSGAMRKLNPRVYELAIKPR